MNLPRQFHRGSIFIGVFLVCSSLIAQDPNNALNVLAKLETGDKAMRSAVAAAKQLQDSSPGNLMSVLIAMDRATPIGKNWLTSVAISLKARQTADVTETLMSFLKDPNHDSEARYLVFQWLTEGKPDLRESMLESMLNDSSLEIRYAAVQQATNRLLALGDEKKSESQSGFISVLESARHPDQVNATLESLKKLGVDIEPASHFGFLKNWLIIGPFDNTDQKAFHTVYEVEKDLVAGTYQAAKKYQGKKGDVTWQEAKAETKEGLVDLNPIFKNGEALEKGAIAYARAQFNSPQQQACQLRLGCINANKVWLNGKLLTSNEVYHSAMQIDQYNSDALLKQGQNEIIVKICQNEQTEQWAQRWIFQLRVCDASGKALKSIE